ncbi:CSC1-like protein HYP1 [Nymphaea colorata]|nr:CSC1-like protein HYP1 [Nymphaea colorata]
MIVSALLTSVGINLGLCILFYALYSILRKQPWNVHVYVPRLVAEKKVKEGGHFQLEGLLPSAGWIKKAWEPSEEELLAVAGFDSMVFMRIFIFSLKIFSVATVIGIFILLPINYFGQQLSDIDYSDIPSQSLDLFTISNVKNGSKWLWVHFAAVYIISGAACYLLYNEHNHITSKRLEYFYSTKSEPREFTIVVRGIPVAQGSSLDDTVEKFYKEYYPSTYLSHEMVHRTSRLQSLINDAENLYKKIVHLKSKATTEGNSEHGGGCFGLRRRTDLVNEHIKKLETLEENARLEQSDILIRGKEIPAAFVSFRSCYDAAAANQIQQRPNPTEWTTEQAPEPRDVYWPFLLTTFLQRWTFKLVDLIAYIALTVLFIVPVVFVQGLANLEELELFFPLLTGLLSITVVSQVITGYLPSLILQMFLSIVPPIIKLFSSLRGYISHSQIERSACRKILWFTVWNIFFVNVLSGSVASQLNVFTDPSHIPMRLAVAVPAQASFFISYVATSGWTSLLLELIRIIPLLRDIIKRHCSKTADHDFSVPSLSYHGTVPKILFFALLGITYSFLAPLILPFLLFYFSLGYVTYRNQLLNVYMPKFETCGKFWPIVHNGLVFSLILMQAIAIGIFALKKLALASSLTIPLPVLTLIFSWYCRKRFLSMLNTYSAESLIKKDREVQNDPMLNEFLDKLTTAYRHPALSPVQYSAKLEDESRTPLLT